MSEYDEKPSDETTMQVTSETAVRQVFKLLLAMSYAFVMEASSRKPPQNLPSVLFVEVRKSILAYCEGVAPFNDHNKRLIMARIEPIKCDEWMNVSEDMLLAELYKYQMEALLLHARDLKRTIWRTRNRIYCCLYMDDKDTDLLNYRREWLVHMLITTHFCQWYKENYQNKEDFQIHSLVLQKAWTNKLSTWVDVMPVLYYSQINVRHGNTLHIPSTHLTNDPRVDNTAPGPKAQRKRELENTSDLEEEEESATHQIDAELNKQRRAHENKVRTLIERMENNLVSNYLNAGALLPFFCRNSILLQLLLLHFLKEEIINHHDSAIDDDVDDGDDTSYEENEDNQSPNVYPAKKRHRHTTSIMGDDEDSII